MRFPLSPSFIQTIPSSISSSSFYSPTTAFSKPQSIPCQKRRRTNRVLTYPCLHPHVHVTVSKQHTRTTQSKQKNGLVNKDTNPSSSSSSLLSSVPTPSLPVSLLLLNFTTVLWGTQHAVFKLALNDISPSTLNFTRFAIAMLLSLPGLQSFISHQQKQSSNISLQLLMQNSVIKQGLELSMYLFAGYALQSAALLTTSASRSAFLLYLNVIIGLSAR